MHDDLEKALHLADIADAITKKYYLSSGLKVKNKPDATPVTQADTEVEEALSKIVGEKYGDAYLGEEGTRTDTSKRIWVVDPIDGTKNFMRGFPIWATLIALVENGETVAAVVSTPGLGRRWWAAKGAGAWTRDVDGTIRSIHVSNVATIADSFLLASTPLSAWDKVAASEAAVQELLKKAWRWRAPGDMINYMWVAEGASDACFEPFAKQWDIEAPKLIVTEAGGSFYSDAKPSTPPDAERAILASNRHLDKALRQTLRF